MDMDLGIAGRRAVVSAGSSGLGRGAALALAQEGADVIIASRSQEHLEEARRDIHRLSGRTPHTFSLDLGRASEVDRFIAEVKRQHGPVDILITNTGGPPAKRFEECSPEDWQTAFQQLFMAPVRLIRGFLPDMRAARWGRIVCITSMAAKEPVENLVLSNSLRAAVTGMAKSLSREVGADGVLINCVGPGFHDTPALGRLVDKLIEQGKASSAEEVMASWASGTSVGRIGDPEAFGRIVALLASEACDYLTGVNLLIDGGRSRGTF
jgi:3-oxoacyl-[acyl-carrier protein] reductase